MPQTAPPLSTVLPPLIFGTATFNYQYTTDPFKLPTTALVHRALSVGVRAFDTSPYYGPAEEILGMALISPYEDTNEPFPRQDYFLLTKVGRIASSEFNYSASWVYKSIKRSLTRLNTTYLDVVYCHDVEFVTSAEVLTAIAELRRIRDTEHTIKYIGISGYPVELLCELAELILKETGEPLDCVMSYANYTLQNRRLKTKGIERLKAAGVDVVPNASILGMGLLRSGGLPKGAMGDWHPAPDGLREVTRKASKFCESKGERIEVVAIQWALESWITAGESGGSKGDPASGVKRKRETNEDIGSRKLGVSVMGVSNLRELDETMAVWRSILDGLEVGNKTTKEEQEWNYARRKVIEDIASGVYSTYAKWQDFAWASPGEDYVPVKPAEVENPIEMSRTET